MVDSDSTIITSEKADKRKLTSEEYLQLKDKLLEIQQINCEERLVYERIKHLNAEKQYLQDLLDILHATDDNDRMKNSRTRQRRLQNIHSS
jgi:hemerythrin superfamily protein